LILAGNLGQYKPFLETKKEVLSLVTVRFADD